MRILFQGDSITDGIRNREDPKNLGEWYAKYAAENIIKAFPGVPFEFVNRGISGNQTADLAGRIQEDIIDVQPDIISIMIGVNDVWHRAETREWLADDVFEANYRKVLTAVKEQTNAKILMLEPYLLDFNEKGYFYEDLDPKIKIIRSLAREFADAYIPLDGIFTAECIKNKVKPDFYSEDGVHPSYEGCLLIAKYYTEAITPLIKTIL